MASHRRLYSILRHLHILSRPNIQTSVTREFSASFHQQVETSPQIIAEPRIALYDEQITICLRGFQQLEKVTLHGQFCHEKQKDVTFTSCGQYTTDTEGKVNVRHQSSEGGTYTGVEPMGIIWSLTSAPGKCKNTRMTINFTDKPSVITVKVYSGHLDLEEIYASDALPQSLAEVQLERWFRYPEKVTRTEVEFGNVRGVLFFPNGDGPFQGVIDLFGSSGGSIEYRSALLASHGFAVLSLPYFRYKDLTKDLSCVTYDYFEEAMEWFASHPKVYQNGLGIVGVSKGAEFALCMSAFSKLIKAAVLINGPTHVTLSDLYYKGKLLLHGSDFKTDDIVFNEDNQCILRNCMPMTEKSSIIPAWKNDTKLLFFISQDDYQYDLNGCNNFVKECPEEKRNNVELVELPGAGHLLEPPYTPLCRSTLNRAFGLLMLFGGQPKEHAHAQEDAWQRTLTHLRKYIPTS